MTLYAPKSPEGLKPYVVTIWDFGRESVCLAYAEDKRSAELLVLGRSTSSRYVRLSRRAQPEDIGTVPEFVP